MAIGRVYVGSVGPFLFDDTATYSAEDTVLGGGVVGAVVTDSPISVGSVRLFDTDTSNVLDITWNENDSADRVLNLLVHGADRSLDLYESFKVVDGQDIELHASGGEKAQLAIDTQNAERTLDMSANLTIASGSAITLTAEDAAGSVTLDNCSLEVEDTIGSGNSIKFIIGTDDASRTITLSENFTIGNGYAGTITFSAASKVFTIDETASLSAKANLAGPTFSGTVTVPSTNFTVGTQVLTQTNLTDLLDGGDTTLHDHDGITENTNARHAAITLNASATTGGMSLSTQEISNRAATNAQTGYATAAHITAIEANSGKVSCTFANVQTALGVADGAVDFNAQALTGVGAIGCGTITSGGNLVIADDGTIGSASATSAIKINSAGNVGIPDCTTGAMLWAMGPDAQDTIYIGLYGSTYSDRAGDNIGFYGGAFGASGGVGSVNKGIHGYGRYNETAIGLYAKATNGTSANYQILCYGDCYCDLDNWVDISHSSKKRLIKDVNWGTQTSLYQKLDKLNMKSYRHQGELEIIGYSETEFEIDSLTGKPFIHPETGKPEPAPIYGNPEEAPERFGLMGDDPDLPAFLAVKERNGLAAGKLANYALLCIKHQKSLIEDLKQRLENLENN